ncbi:MAG: hypothetical protein RL204_1162 [Bacteroidota bacterium]
MKQFLIAIAALATMSCSQNVNAQPTWTVGATTLTETDVVTGLVLPWEITWGPDDFIWATTRPGLVLHIDPTTGNYTTILDKSSVVPEDGSGEPGMLGMCLHPDFATTPKVYIVYNYMQGANTVRERLSSFDWNGTNLVNEEYLIDAIPGYWIHDGSRLMVTTDNKILMSTGDTGDGGDSSQDITALNGKILRINLDGTIPSDNPDPTSYVYSYGHRNSQGLCQGPNGLIYSSEHGQSNSDEFNIIEPNRNYGWPNVEGACNTGAEQTYCSANDVKEPLKEWSPCRAVNGIEYYNHPAIPEWQNSVLMAVLGGLGAQYERLSVLHMSSDGLAIESEDSFFSEFNKRVRDICVNPYTGAVYVAFNGSQYPGAGPNMIKEFRNMAFVGIEQPKGVSSQTLSVYPNPANDFTTLEFSNDFMGATYTIYSFTGEKIAESNITSTSVRVDCSAYAAGNYFVKATTAKGTITKTFVVQ